MQPAAEGKLSFISSGRSPPVTWKVNVGELSGVVTIAARKRCEGGAVSSVLKIFTGDLLVPVAPERATPLQ